MTKNESVLIYFTIYKNHQKDVRYSVETDGNVSHKTLIQTTNFNANLNIP